MISPQPAEGLPPWSAPSMVRSRRHPALGAGTWRRASVPGMPAVPATRRCRQMTGGKGAKGGNLESLGNTGPADDATQRRKPAETGGNPFWGPYSGAKVFSGAGMGRLRRAVGDWRIACGNCGNCPARAQRVRNAIPALWQMCPRRSSFAG